jgi:hypothetical protein
MHVDKYGSLHKMGAPIGYSVYKKSIVQPFIVFLLPLLWSSAVN